MAKTDALDRIITAATRLKALRTEITRIEAQFPGLAEMEAATSARAPKAAPRSPRKRKPMTAAQKKVVGERMRTYWRKRREAQASKRR